MRRVVAYSVAAVIVVALAGYRLVQLGDQSANVHDQMVSILERVPDYATYGPLYTEWPDAHHDAIFDKHHHLGAGGAPPSFEGGAYLEEILAAMAADAEAAGYKDQAREINILQRAVYWEDESSRPGSACANS